MAIERVWIDRWVVAINKDSACLNTGRGFTDSFTIATTNSRFTFHISEGAIQRIVEDGGPLEPSSFTLIADDDVWEGLFSPEPRPMEHAIFAAIAMGNMRFEGDIRPVFQQMATLSEWVNVGRTLNGDVTLAAEPPWLDEWQAVGRYTNVTVDGHRHKVFYFEAGEGIPVLCQHTAGNENRQWRHLLEDRELTKKYRFIAYDLPSHGKSDPPNGKDFFTEDHHLKSEWITQFVVNFSESLQLDRPVFLGCSIGGVIALHLAERFPEKFRGLIALAGAVPTYGFYHDWWIDPGVNIAMMSAGLVDAVMAPDLAPGERQINRIAQTAHPRSARNDLYFWGVDNADPERTKRIDASLVPVYMYAGEYDFTCPPDHVEASAKAIGEEVHYETLKGLGHFPMSENYARFRPTLVKTLADIEDQTHWPREKARQSAKV